MDFPESLHLFQNPLEKQKKSFNKHFRIFTKIGKINWINWVRITTLKYGCLIPDLANLKLSVQ